MRDNVYVIIGRGGKKNEIIEKNSKTYRVSLAS